MEGEMLTLSEHAAQTSHRRADQPANRAESQKESFPSLLRNIVDAGYREPGFTVHGDPENPTFHQKTPATGGVLDLRLLTVGALPGKSNTRALISGTEPGRVVDIPAAIAENSLVCQAGARLIVADDAPSAVSGGEIVLQTQAGGFVLVEPATFGAVVDGHDVGASGWPVYETPIEWETAPSCAVRFNVTRREQRSRSFDIASTLAEAIILGLSKEVDRVLLSAILAARGNSTFNWQGAANTGVRLQELRCFANNPTEISPNTGNFEVSDRTFYYRGIPTELTGAVQDNVVGAFNRGGVAVHPLLSITAKRLAKSGGLELTCFANIQALLPKPEFFWKMA